MNCCPNCFKDRLLSSEVKNLATGNGVCDFCGSQHVPLHPLSSESPLVDRFQSIFDVFALAGKTQENRILNKNMPLLDALSLTWDIFAFDDLGKQATFLDFLFKDEEWYQNLCDSNVDVTPRAGDIDISELEIFDKDGWDSFSEAIKHKSRYFTALQHEEILLDIVDSIAQEVWQANIPLYRARLWNKVDECGGMRIPKDEDLFEAPSSFASSGRMSAEGIPCLYVADSDVTAVSEIRAGMYDTVAVAVLVPKRDFKYVDLGNLNQVSPFDSVDCSSLLVNRE